MTDKTQHKKILIYSHDTFGLGHLRRCRAIAHYLVKKNKNLSILIISGSPIIGSFDFKARVEFIRIPGVIKLHNGEYTSLSLHIDIQETLAMRNSIIKHTAEIFDPDLFIVDKEPLGLKGEVEETLELLNQRGTPCILGLRDVMDEPALLAPEWERKKIVPALDKYFEEIWVYGLPQICDPLEGINIPTHILDKITYTGYLKRTIPTTQQLQSKIPDKPYILVTTGGGGDGEMMIDQTLKAYETDPSIPWFAVIVLGPFMKRETQNKFIKRGQKLNNVKILRFDSNIERYMEHAIGVVAMGGYNTFCEILSFDKRAIIIPRTKPRMEQYIRASKAAKFGLIQILTEEACQDPKVLATAIKGMAHQYLPSEIVLPGILDGLNNVNKLTKRQLKYGRHPLQTLKVVNSQ